MMSSKVVLCWREVRGDDFQEGWPGTLELEIEIEDTRYIGISEKQQSHLKFEYVPWWGPYMLGHGYTGLVKKFVCVFP